MKTRRILTSALASFLLSTIAIAEIRSTPYQEMTASAGERTHTTLYEGNRIPFVNLPVVEIVEQSGKPRFLPAKVVKGEFTAIANLPVVEIVANNPGYNRLPVVYADGSKIASVDLPIVDISADLPLEHLVAVKLVNGEPLASATLETVEICESRLPVKNIDENVLAAWNPSVQSNPDLMIGRDGHNTFYLMSYQGTAVDQKGEQVLVYRLVSSIKQTVFGQIRELIRQLGHL